MFHLIPGMIGLYVVWRFVWPLPLGATGKTVLAVLMLLTAGHRLVIRNLFGTIASPEIPTVVIIILGWAFGTLILLATFLLIKDLAGLLSYPLSRRVGQTLLGAPKLLYGIGLGATVLAGVGVWQAIRVPDVKTIEIVLPRLPQELDGLRVVQLTDLHASKLLQAPWIAAVVAKANALNPDLIVLTGDLVDGTPQARAADVQPLRDLAARYGVHAIPGNHEYYADYLSWLSAFEQLGIPLLLNEHVTITHNGRKLVLAGITDRTAAAFGQARPDVTAALKDISTTDPVILLSHRPTDAAINASAGVDLQLSGHTHGGQILGFHMLVKRFNEGFVSGLYQVNNMRLYVSNGAGLWNGFPIRLGRPAEITQIVLRSGKAGATVPAPRASTTHQPAAFTTGA
ncbi:metallophosphoesterase [Alcaligenaceae bacterium CGII-47]|nr:metallophosphoesterase [Alcaligenaceae bacterium CGII-47]